MNEIITRKRHKLYEPPKPALKISGYRLVTLAGNNPKFTGWKEGEEVSVVTRAHYVQLCNDAFMWRNCGAIG